MAKTKIRRTKSDPVAVASQGRATSKIEAQSSSDKSRINETDEDVPRILSTKT